MSGTHAKPFRMHSKIAGFSKAFDEDVAKTLRLRREEFIPSRNVLGYTHGHSWNLGYEGNPDTDQMKKLVVETSLKFDEIIENDISVIPIQIESVTEGMMRNLMQTMYQTINESTKKSGNTIDNRGKPFEANHFLEMLKKIEFGVDENGKVCFPEIHASPELAKTIAKELSSQGPEFENQINALVEEKIALALSKEKDRKSKFPKREDS